MKKTFALILGLVAVSAQAVSFSWTSANQISFDGTILNASGKTASAYLVYLGTDGAWSFGDDVSGLLANITDIKKDESVTRTTGSNSAKGKITPKTWGEDGNAGSSYGVVLTYTDASGAKWFNISSDVYTIPVGTADNALDLAHSFQFSFNKGGEVQKLGTAQVGTGWYTPVPEPGIACMALLGIGMMIKRRRA